MPRSSMTHGTCEAVRTETEEAGHRLMTASIASVLARLAVSTLELFHFVLARLAIPRGNPGSEAFSSIISSSSEVR